MGLLKELFSGSTDAGGVHADLLLRDKEEEGARRLSTYDQPPDWSAPAHPDPDDDGSGPADTVAADPDVESVLEVTRKAFSQLAERARQELDDAVRTAPDLHEGARRALAVVEKYQPELSQALTVAQLAALLVGMRRVAESVPETAAPPKAETIPQPEVGESVVAVGETPAGLAVVTEPTFEVPEVAESLRLPLIEEAVQALASRKLLTRSEYEAMADAAQTRALAVSGVENENTLAKIRDALTDAVQQGTGLKEFGQRVREAVGSGTMLAPGTIERVFRTGVQLSYSEGMDRILAHRALEGVFPYEMTAPVRDSRLSTLCDVVSRSGIQGTNIYRSDDPQYELYKPPRHINCRCSRIPMSVEMAARHGIEEAKRWLETGEPPAHPAFVPPIPAALPKGWSHGLLALSLARLGGA